MTDHADPGPGGTSGRPPTFTSWLRQRSDSELAALFAYRPDLVTPVPADIGALAARATARPAVLRVLDRLDRFTLCVLEGLVALGDDRMASGPGVHPDRLATAVPAPAERVGEAAADLLSLALVWRDGDLLRPVTVLRDILRTPAGLGPPLRALLGERPAERLNTVAADLGLPTGYAQGDPADRIAAAHAEPGRLDRLLALAGDDARPVLDRLTWGPPQGTVSGADRPTGLASAASPIDRLLALALLVPVGADTVALPREVALHLRGGRLFQDVPADPPPLTGAAADPAAAMRAAAGQVFTVLRSVEELLERWSEDPPGVLRSGGLGTRDLRRAARDLDTDDTGAAVLIETAHAAGLLAASGEVDGEWLPTPDFDLWRRIPGERRWLRLAEAWLRSPRVASLNGTRDPRGRPRTILGPGLDRRSAPEVRMDALLALAAAPEGTAPAPEAVAARLAWLRPRRQGTAYTELLDTALREAALLGLTGAGALAPHARALLEEAGTEDTPLAERDKTRAGELLAAELPKPLDRILVQGDLTAVAPGPLVPDLARELALSADVESTGGATVYRFSADSVRRALDAGRGADDLIAMLERHSATDLPQPLRYLVADVARRHGRLRIGTASSYLRCDEPSVLDELHSDRRAADLGLFRLAPTVLASRTMRPVLMTRLAELGYHPVAEAADGTVQLTRPEARRADPRTAPPPGRDLEEPAPPGPELRMAAVRAVRAGDEAATARRHPVPAPDSAPPRSSTAATMSVLSQAAAEGRRVWIGYLDSDGRASSRIVEPARVEGGFLTAYDATRAAVHRFAVHRITGVADLDSPADPPKEGA
ncbi:helicase-associated domain-containing protein [Streptomonospora sp. S1-112]|uniref:Helicase-associated domain-containing protein n=1 Tax=Streptomonospora mangrovi TaxID=2883123 RepID=A0A9X3NMT6_9ACTN|nr:helicase-associated domain-containing protein [Streptomonospora mangrovi]MDA0566629.1 helicase-associated domain-containing protein [Streptomonospora mangrovi]